MWHKDLSYVKKKLHNILLMVIRVVFVLIQEAYMGENQNAAKKQRI